MGINYNGTNVTRVFWSDAAHTNVEIDRVYWTDSQNNRKIVYEAPRYVEGTWLFFPTLTTSLSTQVQSDFWNGEYVHDESVNFQSNDVAYNSFAIVRYGGTSYGRSGGRDTAYAYNNETWSDEGRRIITFTSRQQVSASFYGWLLSNAMPCVGVPTGTNYVYHKGLTHFYIVAQIKVKPTGGTVTLYQKILKERVSSWTTGDYFEFSAGLKTVSLGSNQWQIKLKTNRYEYEICRVTSTSLPNIGLQKFFLTEINSIENKVIPVATLHFLVDYYGDIMVTRTYQGIEDDTFAWAPEFTGNGADRRETIIYADCGTLITLTHMEGESLYFSQMYDWEEIQYNGSVAVYRVPPDEGDYYLSFDHS